MTNNWVCCPGGKGFLLENGAVSKRERHFKANAVGIERSREDGLAIVWLIGFDQKWAVPEEAVFSVDIKLTDYILAQTARLVKFIIPYVHEKHDSN